MSIRDELEVTVGASDVLSADRYAALVSLCRLLADQIDESGDEASNRLTAAYLSALKDLSRATGEQKKEPVGGSLSSVKTSAGKKKRAA